MFDCVDYVCGKIVNGFRLDNGIIKSAGSPEPWSVKHYAPIGFEFAKKPVRVKKSKDADADNAE